eukprot:4747076-Pleurochrysis_carterae.AAC.2
MIGGAERSSKGRPRAETLYRRLAHQFKGAFLRNRKRGIPKHCKNITCDWCRVREQSAVLPACQLKNGTAARDQRQASLRTSSNQAARARGALALVVSMDVTSSSILSERDCEDGNEATVSKRAAAARSRAAASSTDAAGGRS